MIAVMSVFERLQHLVATWKQWPWAATLQTLKTRFKEDRLGVTAGSLTFTTTIALVPLLTVMLALFSAFPMFSRFRKALETQFLSELVPELIAKQVVLMLTRFAGKASQLGGVSMLVLGLTAMLLMLTMDRTLNGIWRVQRPRPMTQRVLVYWGALTLGPLLLGVSLSASSWLLSASRGWADEVPGGLALVLSVLVWLLQALGFAALFRFVPNTPVKWEHALSGGVFTAIGLELAQRGLGIYLSKAPVYASVYGAFAALPIFLIWLYLSWLMILLGAVVAAYAPVLLSQLKRWPDEPGYQFQMALAAIRQLQAAQHQPKAGYSALSLARRLRTDTLQLEPVLEVLMDLDWVGLLDEPEAEEGGRIVLLCDPDQTPLAPLVEQLLLKQDPSSAAFWRHAQFDGMVLGQALVPPA